MPSRLRGTPQGRTPRRVVVSGNAKGKVTLAFAEGLKGIDKSDAFRAMEEILKDLG